MKRFLVLAPHPDDEVVGCAIAIRRAVELGDTPFVLYLTTGIPPIAALWPWQRGNYAARVARRRAEAEAAAVKLSLVPLGIRDWPSRTLKDNIDAALDLIGATIAEHRIDELWAPAWEGAHQDHDVANFLAAQFAGKCSVMEFAEYNFAGSRVRSGEFAARNGTERIVRLTDDEQRWKTNLLRLYRTERGNLAHCDVRQESLRPLAAYDYAAAPHQGRLFYERFQWVPLRHPRVDFDRPDAVLARIAQRSVAVAARPCGDRLLSSFRTYPPRPRARYRRA